MILLATAHTHTYMRDRSCRYTARAPHTCAKFAASCMHELIDIKQWANWTVDYMKDDSCVRSLCASCCCQQRPPFFIGRSLVQCTPHTIVHLSQESTPFSHICIVLFYHSVSFKRFKQNCIQRPCVCISVLYVLVFTFGVYRCCFQGSCRPGGPVPDYAAMQEAILEVGRPIVLTIEGAHIQNGLKRARACVSERERERARARALVGCSDLHRWISTPMIARCVVDADVRNLDGGMH